VNVDLKGSLAMASTIIVIVFGILTLSSAQETDPPTINMITEFPITVNEGSEILVMADVIDVSEIQSVFLTYEIDGLVYTDPMYSDVAHYPDYRYLWNYTNYDIGLVSQLIVTILNITALDEYSNPGVVNYGNNFTIIIQKEDLEGPEITFESTPLYTESEDHMFIRADVQDPSDVASVKLHYEVDDIWYQSNMKLNEEVNLYEAIVGPFETDTNVRYYVNATDLSPNHNQASTLDENGDMMSFVASHKLRFEGKVDQSDYLQVPELHRYRMGTPNAVIIYENYIFDLELSETGILHGVINVSDNGSLSNLVNFDLAEKSNIIIADETTKDGVVYDFNLKYLSYDSNDKSAELEINPRQKLVFEGYEILSSITKDSGSDTTFVGRDGGNWTVEITVKQGYNSVTHTFTSRNQFIEFYIGDSRDIQIMYLGEELVEGDILRYQARLRVYKFQPPIFKVISDVPTGSPPGLSEGQIIYNVYAGDELEQKVIAQNTAGSRAYNVDIQVENETGGLVIFPGELTSSLGSVYREKNLGGTIIKYYLTYGMLTKSLDLRIPTGITVRETATFDVIVSYTDAHDNFHQIRIPVLFLIYPSPPDLQVTKTLLRQPHQIGLESQARIEILNTGGSPANNVTVTDNTPPNLISDFVDRDIGKVQPGQSNKVSLSYKVKPTTITKPGQASYGFVTVNWKGVCHKPGVRIDANTISTQVFYFEVVGPYLEFIEFSADRSIVEQAGQQMIFINVGERVKIDARVKNDGNRIAKNLSLSFPGFIIESTDFPEGTDMEVDQYLNFEATIIAVNEGILPFQLKITHGDEYISLGNIYEVYSDYILAQTYLSPIVVNYIETPEQIAAGETVWASLSIRNIGRSPVENAMVLLDLSRGLRLEYGTYIAYEGTLGSEEEVIVNIQVKGTEFGLNKITATASGREIPDIDYVYEIEVLSPNVEIVRTVDDEYLLAKQDYWPRSSEIISWVTLNLTNTGNDDALMLVLSETLPTGIISWDNLTYGTNLIIWGEMEDLSLAPNETMVLRYPIWSKTPGHLIYQPASAEYNNGRGNLFETESNQLDIWVLANRPFIVPEGSVEVTDEFGNPLVGTVSYNDTVTFTLSILNIGNGEARSLDIGEWTGNHISDIDCVVLNKDEITGLLQGGIKAAEILELPIKVSVREDVLINQAFPLQFKVSYLDGDGRAFAQYFESQIQVRPTTVQVTFTKTFWRSAIAPGERPKLRIQVTNVGDTDLFDIRAVVGIPADLIISESPIIETLREGESGEIEVLFDPVLLPEGEVYESYQGFITRVEYQSFRGPESTPDDGIFISLSIAEPFIEITRSITSSTILARNDDWPFSDQISENVTITLTNRADVKAEGIMVVETIPDGLYTLDELGTSQIVWGDNGGIDLDVGESISFTYPTWSFEEGISNFKPAIASYRDPSKNEYQSFSVGLESVETVLNRPYIIWEDLVQDPAGSLTFNDTFSLTFSISNIGNGRATSMNLTDWTTGDISESWVVLNHEILKSDLDSGLFAATEGDYTIRLRILEDVESSRSIRIPLVISYSDEVGEIYFAETQTEILVRKPQIKVSTSLFDGHYVLMPFESGFFNISITNTGDTDLSNFTIIAENPEGLNIRDSGSIAILREGESANISVIYAGVDSGESVGRLFDKINLSISYTDFRAGQKVRKIGTVNLSVKRPMLVFKTYDPKLKTRIGGKFLLSMIIGNDGSYPASGIRILLGGLAGWVTDISAEGVAINGDELIIDDLNSLDQQEINLVGKVLEKGEFSVVPRVVYRDGAGNEYELLPDSFEVKSGEMLYKMLLPFILWAAVGIGIAGIYYYETRIAEKIKGHQLGSLASSVITHVDATQMVPPLIPYKKKKLSLAEFTYLLSLYLTKVNSTSVKKADKTTFIISHPQSRLVPGQYFRNLVVVKDAYMLVAQMIQNRVKSSQVVPPTFLVQGFKVGISDLAFILSLAVAKVRAEGTLPRSVTVPGATRVSAGDVEKRESEPTEPASGENLDAEEEFKEEKEESEAETVSEMVPISDEEDSSNPDKK